MKLKFLPATTLLSLALATLPQKGFTQTSTEPAMKLSGYVDGYYAAFSDSMAHGNFQKWPSVNSRGNQFGLNTMLFTAQYDGDKYRGIVTMHFGDIAKSTWDATYNAIMEAHAGIRLRKGLWLDAGFFRTHVGTEGVLPKENITSSVAVGTFHEPYYESGVRLNYKHKKLEVNLFVLNGYNIYIENNKKKSLGLLVNYALNDKVALGYSNYIGDDAPDGSVAQMRVYQNLFMNYDGKRWKLQVGGDYGTQQHSDMRDTNNIKTATMFSGLITAKYKIKKVHGVYSRFEIFQDPSGFLCTKYPDNMGRQLGYSLWGVTVGGEYKPTDNSYIRIEGRQIQTKKDELIFVTNGKATNTRMEMHLNVGISF